jgi:hypothetical protein
MMILKAISQKSVPEITSLCLSAADGVLKQ